MIKKPFPRTFSAPSMQNGQDGGVLPYRRSLLGLVPAMAATAALAVWRTPAHAQAMRTQIRLAGPPAAVSFPLIHMVESGALAHDGLEASFTLWTNPDQLRAWSVDGGVDIVASPSNVAANLHNRGVPLKLLNVSVWGMLWLVSRDAGAGALADFRGHEIVVPFRGDMPDILFRLLAQAQGLDPRKDVSLRYVATPFDAIQLLVTRRANHALLPEPAVSMALRKTQSFPVSMIAPALYRSVNLSREWGRVFQREPRIPQAGIAALGAAGADAALCERIRRQYAASQTWCRQNAGACGAMVAKHIPMLLSEAVADAIQAARDEPMDAARTRPELEYFFGLLRDAQPGLIGGKLPGADFYGG